MNLEKLIYNMNLEKLKKLYILFIIITQYILVIFFCNSLLLKTI
jgi:hypothetical protein